MQIIDRYVLRLFLKVFVVCFVSLTGLYVTGDAVNNATEFIGYAEGQGGLLQVLGSYYGARVLTFFDVTSGIMTLFAVVFSVAWMQRHNEMMALMAAGVCKSRVVVPLIAAVVVTSLVAAANRELVIPTFRKKLSRNAQNWLGENAQQLQPRWDNQSDILIDGQHLYANEHRIEKPRFQLPASLNQFGRQLVAANAYYLQPEGKRPAGYLLKQVQQPANLVQLPSAKVDGKSVILAPGDTPWLKSDECFVPSGVSFEQLEGGKFGRQYSSTAELIAGLRNPSLDFATVRVTIHARIVQPFLDVTLLFLGLPLVLSRGNRNIFLAVGLCLLVVVGFFVIVLVCHSLGTSSLVSPAFAAWIPLIVLVPVAAAMWEPRRW